MNNQTSQRNLLEFRDANAACHLFLLTDTIFFYPVYYLFCTAALQTIKPPCLGGILNKRVLLKNVLLFSTGFQGSLLVYPATAQTAAIGF